MKLDIIKRHGRAAVGRQEVEMVSLNRWRRRKSTRETDEYKIFVDLFDVLFFYHKKECCLWTQATDGRRLCIEEKK